MNVKSGHLCPNPECDGVCRVDKSYLHKSGYRVQYVRCPKCRCRESYGKQIVLNAKPEPNKSQKGKYWFGNQQLTSSTG